MREVLINGRWPILLPDHRADRPEWPWWEATRLAAMAHHVGGGDVLWDVGAEEGDFPGLFASWGCQIVMAEPNPRVWPNIRAIWEANQLIPPLATWPGFFGSETRGEASNEPWPSCAYGEIISDHGFCQLSERPDLPSVTIDAMVDRGVIPPTVITMDVEGSELEVLTGAVRTLTNSRPKVFVSIHPEFMLDHYGVKDGVAVVRGFMEAVGYDEKFLTTDHEHHWMFLPR